MKLKLTILFLLFTPLIFAQTNLAPNPSFEDYTTCPNGQCQIIYATGWDSYSYSPDYFNACSANFSVPQNPFGYQLAATGDAYIGIGFYCCGSSYEEREYIGAQLLSPLVIGKRYKAEMKVSFAGNNFDCCAVNKLGVLFSTISYAMGSPCMHIPIYLPHNFAHIYTNNIILDTANWVTISGSFVADSAYQYIIIGNLFHNDSINYTVVNSSTNAFLGTNYYIDDVSVEIDTSNSIPVIQNMTAVTIKVFPNPATNGLTIDFSIKDKYFFKLYDLFGAKRLTASLDNNSKTVDLTGVDCGVYVYTIFDDKGIKIKTDKLIIIK